MKSWAAADPPTRLASSREDNRLCPNFPGCKEMREAELSAIEARTPATDLGCPSGLNCGPSLVYT